MACKNYFAMHHSMLFFFTTVYLSKTVYVNATSRNANYSTFLPHLKPLAKCQDCCLVMPSKDEKLASLMPFDIQKIFLNLQNDKVGNTTTELNKQKHLITVYQGDDMSILETLVSLLAYVDDNIFVYVGYTKPIDEILNKITRPIAWLTQSSGRTNLYLHCPKIGLPKVSSFKLMETCGPIGCTGKPFSIDNIVNNCKNALEGQVVRFKYHYAFAEALFPEIFGLERMSGYSIEMLYMLEKYFHFKLQQIQGTSGRFDVNKDTYTPGYLHDIIIGNADLTMAGINGIFQSNFDFGHPQCLANLQYITRAPRPIRNFKTIFKPFPVNVWLSFFAILLCLGCMMYFAYKMYFTEALGHFKLCQKERSMLNFLIFPFSKIAEPEPLPWFKKWSSGKLIVFLWHIASTFFIMFYTSNLRAHLITIEYEKPPNTLEDIALSGNKVYIHTTAWRQRKAYLTATGQVGSAKYRIAEIAEQTGGLYDPVAHHGMPAEASYNVIEKGAFLLLESNTIPYLYVTRPLLRQKNIHIVNDDRIGYYYTSFLLKKNSPATKHVNFATLRAFDSGLFVFWKTQHLPFAATIKSKAPQVGLVSFKLNSFYSSFIFFAVSLMISVVQLTLEFLCHRPSKLKLYYYMIEMKYIMCK